MPVYDLPGFPVINNAYDFGPVIRLDQVYDFWNAFCRHQELLVSSVRNQQFDRFDVNVSLAGDRADDSCTSSGDFLLPSGCGSAIIPSSRGWCLTEWL